MKKMEWKYYKFYFKGFWFELLDFDEGDDECDDDDILFLNVMVKFLFWFFWKSLRVVYKW